MTDKELPPIYSKDYSHDIASLRDMFAAKAMQGILSNNSMIDTATESTFEWVTKNAYQLADAMLRAREK
ncbi:hypothetical protein [Morganella morganii]|uniref:hypothetical protein n=1 Tax=Morganella morganii TaxID=582 RepID=UPI00237D46D7|nr:hypothetical protein [Morganella morganii]EKQ1113553.1 hypothetical protein [Morganella morganii]MDE2535577.1 hypothetical protein [Morganella morganii]HCL5895656.1 hypothetical protein [Morganella morganii]